jgi:hypothetical protein
LVIVFVDYFLVFLFLDTRIELYCEYKYWHASSADAEKWNDKIIYELTEIILVKLAEKLDIVKVPRSLIQSNVKDGLNSLTSVLQQEFDRSNRLINIIQNDHLLIKWKLSKV